MDSGLYANCTITIVDHVNQYVNQTPTMLIANYIVINDSFLCFFAPFMHINKLFFS